MLTTTTRYAEDRHEAIPAGQRRLDEPTVAVRRRSPLAVAVVGLVLTGLSAGALVFHVTGSDVSPARPAPIAAEQPATVSTTELVYEPGRSSGWHVHPGVHSVEVRSGTLTVYDEACRRQDYGPGQTYVGGRAPHVVHNRGAEDAVLAVTYVADPSTDSPGRPVPAPSGCEAA